MTASESSLNLDGSGSLFSPGVTMFNALNPLPADPILGLSAAYKQDSNPHKIDLGVGVYKDEAGHTPIMEAVKRAEQLRLDSENTKTYQSPAGDPEYDRLIANLLLGEDADRCRVDSVQVPGGTGGLRVAAGLVKRCNSNATVWLGKYPFNFLGVHHAETN